MSLSISALRSIAPQWLTATPSSFCGDKKKVGHCLTTGTQLFHAIGDLEIQNSKIGPKKEPLQIFHFKRGLEKSKCGIVSPAIYSTYHI
jgi:hypothetical protein